MEVLPALVVLVIAVVFLWLRYRDKQVAAEGPERGRASAPSPRDLEGHSGYVELVWDTPPGEGANGSGLRLHDPATGEEIDESAVRLPSDRFEVVGLVDARPEALERGDVVAGVPVRIERPDDATDATIEVRAGGSGELLGLVDPARATDLASSMDAGRRLEGLALRVAPSAGAGSAVDVLLADRGVLPPVPDEPSG